ncbi:MAG TPA: NADP-specific glutamate dehydrogenase [Erysipelothrix sp.]|nr:NADP-specific glutamate dehydrogenase [Erysipelothrix sp.]
MYDLLKEFHAKYPDEKMFENTTQEFVDSIHEYLDEEILNMVLHSERIITFRVPWVDDAGKLQVNYGYRVQHSSALGPYKGGIRFDPSVTLDVMKFLAFEQTFKNALTGLPLGGAKGGADFNPVGKSDREIMTFCQNYMNELYRHIGATVDVPAGDIGVGHREIGYMVGQYKKLTASYEGVYTGKPLILGGAKGRSEATGYGVVYITQELLHDLDETIKDKKVIVTGSGKVGAYAAKKAMDLGAKVVAMNDISGTIVDENGLDIDEILKIKIDNLGLLEEYAQNNNLTLYDPSYIWNVKCDIALPCATQNELNKANLQKLIDHGTKYLIEGANKPLDHDAVVLVQASDLYYIPGKAANAGGVATSGIEMMQNAQMDVYSFEEVDARLHEIMKGIYKTIKDTAASVNKPFNFVVGANLAGYKRVEEAIKFQGAV